MIAVCAGALAGGALQFLVQLPAVVREVRGFRLSLGRGVPEVGGALRAFGPVLAGRGVVQLSSWLDLILASLLLPGALSALGPAQMLYLLPVSLFGVSAAAAALPEMATAGSGGGPDGPAPHLDRALAGVAFFALPATAVLLAFSPLVVGAFFRSGRFGEAETRQVAAILLVLAVGLPAATLSRSLQNAFYALRETRWPARVAVFRVVAGTAVAIPLMFWLDRFPRPRGGERRPPAGGPPASPRARRWAPGSSWRPSPAGCGGRCPAGRRRGDSCCARAGWRPCRSPRPGGSRECCRRRSTWQPGRSSWSASTAPSTSASRPRRARPRPAPPCGGCILSGAVT
ncbi:MAG: hypothetical protein M5U13_06130 [Thermoanaerobaculia bacterium]|nr:hypothetical protein [Thermoanaerobaculia bacterium]